MGKLINVNFGFKPSSPEIAGVESELRPELLARVYEIRVAAEGVRAVKANDPDAVEAIPASVAPVIELRPAKTNPLFEQAREQVEQAHSVVDQPVGNVLSLDAARQAVEEAHDRKAA